MASGLGAVGLVVTVPLALAGGLLAALGVWNGYAWYRMRSITPTAIGEVGDGGLVEIEGTVADPADEEHLLAPYTGTACVAYDYDLAAYTSGGDDAGDWSKQAANAEAVPFLVEDDTGTALVDPEASTVLLRESDFERRSNSLAGAPSGAKTVVEEGRDTRATREGPVDLPEASRYRFTESTLVPGDEAYVVGPATADPTKRPAGSPATAVVGGSETGSRLRRWLAPSRISDVDADEERRRTGRGAVAALVVGTGLVALGVLGTLAVLG